jgi:hypothetical protein
VTLSVCERLVLVRDVVRAEVLVEMLMSWMAEMRAFQLIALQDLQASRTLLVDVRKKVPRLD